MSIDVSYLTSARTTTSGTTAPKKELDKEAFLQLLVAQLRNQDPSSPMDSSQLMTQTTQLTTMERLLELSETSREAFALQMRSAAAGLVGKTVTWTDAEGRSQTGTATGVSYAGAVPTVRVGEVDVPLDAIASVTEPSTAGTGTGSSAGTGSSTGTGTDSTGSTTSTPSA